MFKPFAGLRWSGALFAAMVVASSSCVSTDGVNAPGRELTPRRSTSPSGGVVISQVYGGGGNSGATLKNDFVELYNNSNSAVSLNGWSVQYASAAGTTWAVTSLSNVSLAPGQYYLVQEAIGAGGTTNLPTADATGTIAMSATAGKVALVSSITALTGSCPVGVLDLVGYGTANCSETTATAALSNTTAAIRNGAGTTDTDNNSLDFTIIAPTPRNTASATTTPVLPSGNVGPVATVIVTPSPGSVKTGQTVQFAAVGKDASNATSTTTFTWSSADATIATINTTTGLATGVAVGSTTITATSANSVAASVTINVTAPTGAVNVSSGGPLPVGFQTQVFATGTDALGGTITSNSQVNWSSADAAILTVSAAGVVTAKGVGSAKIFAAAKSDGTTGSTTITVVAGTLSATARLTHNTDLGTPTDANPSDDFIIARREYTLSYNPNHGGPNWVSWNLDASHQGGSPRCNCFTADPAVAAFGFPAYDTNDWINGGVYSRGHMSPSADWNITDGDNAPTYYLSNMLPQNQTLNGGAWGNLENVLRTFAVGSAELYVISGPIFTKNRSGAGIDGLGFLNSTTVPGKIAVPDSIWKIAIIVPDASDVTQIASPAAVQVIAANFPNDATGTGTYNRYSTTIDAIQRSTGYNFLSLIPEAVQCRLETRNCPPVPLLVSASGSTTVALGSPFVLNTSATDADGADGPWRLVLEWGDGTTFTSTLASLPSSLRPFARAKTYAAPGQYLVRLTITDKNGNKGVQTLLVNVVGPT